MKKEIWDAVAGIDERFILEAAEVQRQAAGKQSLPESGNEKVRTTTRRWSWGKAAVIVFCLGLTAAGVALLLHLAPWYSGGSTRAANPSASIPVPTSPSETDKAGETDTKTSEHVDSGLDAEVQAAIDAKENKRFWRVEETGSFPDSVSTYTWTALDAEAIWPVLRDRIIGEDGKYTQGRKGNTLACSFMMDGEAVDAFVYPYGEILFRCKSPKCARKIAEMLAEEEAERLGLTMGERMQDHTNVIRFVRTPQLGELPLDLHYSNEFAMGKSGVWTSADLVMISCPIGELRESVALSSAELLSPEDVEATLLFMNALPNERPVSCVEVYQSCEPVCYADVTSGTIRPAWRIDGIQFVYWTDFEQYVTHHLVLIVDAQSGEIFIAEGENS